MMDITEKLRKWAESFDRNGYLNGSILVAKDGDVLLHGGYGMANWEHGVPNRPDTKFRIASLTKSFTAAAILQLHQEKKLDINDHLHTHLPDYPNGDKVTIYHCLTNSSGIPNYTSFPDFYEKTMRLPSTLEKTINSFKNLDLLFEPGTAFDYSNSGYALLTAIIEKVSGMPYGQYLQENILKPLGMHDSGCHDGSKLVPGLASGYSFWEAPVHPAYTDMSFPLGAYGMYSTTGDLLRWDQALLTHQLLSKELSDLMNQSLHGYACGWIVSELLGKKELGHFGDISGYYCDFLRYIDDNLTVIFLSNLNVTQVTFLSRQLAKIAFGEQVPLPQPLEAISLSGADSLAGNYFAGNNREMVLDVSCKEGQLYVTVPKMYGVPFKFKLVPIHVDGKKAVCQTEIINEQLVFHYNDSGEVEYVSYTNDQGIEHRGVIEAAIS